MEEERKTARYVEVREPDPWRCSEVRDMDLEKWMVERWSGREAHGATYIATVFVLLEPIHWRRLWWSVHLVGCSTVSRLRPTPHQAQVGAHVT